MRIKDDTNGAATRRMNCRGQREESKEAAQKCGKVKREGTR